MLTRFKIVLFLCYSDECKCESFANFTNSQIAEVCTNMQKVEKDIETSGEYEADDFTFVTQPFFNDITTPPQYPVLNLLKPDI